MESLSRILLLCFALGTVLSTAERDLTKEPGHLKPFGSGKPTREVKVVEGFPEQKTFLTDHVIGSLPLKMKGAAALSPAFKLWTDDYFLNMAIPVDSTVHVETKKKEDRQQRTEQMNFKDFLKIYNNTERYMVDDVPEYLGKDVVFPCALQCQSIMDTSVVAALMWFSSGGTKSVVHADAVDNINCVFRGDKTFIMVDTITYKDKVDLDHPEGLYSSVDVDKVDFQKFPGLAEVDYYEVNVTAGDCLYIPYRWVHQVRSYDSNLAVNVWFDHHASIAINVDACYSSCNTNLFLNSVPKQGLDSIALSIGSIKDQFKSTAAIRSIDLATFRHMFSGEKVFDGLEEAERTRIMEQYNDLADDFFHNMDADGNEVITTEDLEKLPEDGWWDAQTYIREIEQLFHGESEDDEDDEHDEL